MRKIVIVLNLVLLLTGTCFAKECIVNKNTKIVRSWTSGRYIGTPAMSVDEELKIFKTNPAADKRVLKYENGDIVVTEDEIPQEIDGKAKVLDLLDDEDVKEKIKKIKNNP